MPKADETQVFLELTEYSLHALRVSGGTVEAGGECLLENKPGLEALLDAVAPSRKTGGLQAVAAVWPGEADWHVSTDTEAMLDRTSDALKAIAAADQKAAFVLAACNATDGGAVNPDGLDKWVLAAAPREAQLKVAAVLNALNADTDGASPSAFAAIGAVSAALKSEGKDGAVILWDLGSVHSTLLLVTSAGIEAAEPCAVGMESIFEAVQTALKLKFRGAGARLFFNEGYDFTDPGPKVGATIAARLKEALGGLPATPAPPALACLGLTSKQAWFVREAAAAAGLTQWTPDIGTFSSGLGLKFADDSVMGSFSASSAGVLGLAALGTRASDDWSPEWVEAEPAEEEPTPTPEPEEPEPEPEPKPVARPVAPTTRQKPALSAEPSSGPQVTFSAKPSRPPVPPRSTSVPPAPSQAPQPGSTRPPMPAAPQVRLSTPSSASPPAPTFSIPPAAPRTGSFSSPAFPLPGGTPPEPGSAPGQGSFSNPGFPMPGGAPAPRQPSFSNPGFPMPGGTPAPRQPSFSNPGFPAPGGAPPPPPKATPPPPEAAPELPDAPPKSGTTPAVTALPFEAVKLKPLPKDQPAKAPAKSRVGFYVGIGVVASLVFAAIAIVVEARLEKIKAYDLEQQEALAHHKAEEQLLQEEQARKDDEERSRKETEQAVALAKKLAEEDTRRAVLAEVEAERLSKLPGTLVVATVPAGALLSVDGAAPVKTPAKVEGLSPGNHRVQITLAGHESVDTSTEILGSKTTDMGSLSLPSIYGSVALTSSPDGLEFAFRLADDPTGKPVRTGRTPATYEDIPHGSYIVTFTRPGCQDHTEKVTVEKATKSAVDTKYLDGSLELTSDPSGATVTKDGAFLGTTPLSLHDLTPKVQNFELKLPGYDPTPISCQIPEGDTLKYAAQLLLRDRVFTAAEVKTAPVAVESPAPALSAAQKKAGADVLLSLVVLRDGTVTGVEVVSATDDDIARRCKTAVEKWKFKPATAPDDRTVQSRIEQSFKFAAGAP
jgi:TonB family protein